MGEVLDSKEAASLGMPWEQEFGYSQAVRVGDSIYIAGQVSHDDRGDFLGEGDMEVQMRQAYANMQHVLERYGASLGNLTEEVLYVTDMDAAFAAATKIRREVFGGFPTLASTIVEIKRLAFPQFMIEIRGTARV